MNRHRVRILLIEDDEDYHILIREMLSAVKSSRYRVTWASTYDEGLREIKEGEHDVCLLDYRLGGRDGLEFLREMGGPECRYPVIFLTGAGDYELDLEAMKAGVSDYLDKSEINPYLLERSIRYAMERRRAEDALRKAYEEMEGRVEERTAQLASANEELKRNAEKIALFAYSVSHDLKSPAMAVHGLARNLHERYAQMPEEKVRAYCERIMKATEHLVALVENINLYIRTRETPVSMERIPLKEMIRIVRSEFSSQMAARGIRWIEPQWDPEILGDRLSVIRIFRNLVDNALKYGGDSLREIEIGYREDRDFHLIFVRDDGVGLKEEDAERVFGLFVRRTPSREVEGAGLGLAIVREIARLHKGNAWNEPNREKGMTFYVSLSKNLSLPC